SKRQDIEATSQGSEAASTDDADVDETPLPRVYPESVISDVEWARQHHEELEHLRVNSLAYRFEEWVSVGQHRGVWVIDRERACEPTALVRLPANEYDRLPDVGVAKLPQLRLRRYRAETPDDEGRMRRAVI